MAITTFPASSGGGGGSALPTGAVALLGEVSAPNGFIKFNNGGLGLAAGKYLIEAVETSSMKNDCMFQLKSQKNYVNKVGEANNIMRITLPVAEDYLDIWSFEKLQNEKSGLGWSDLFNSVKHANSTTYNRLPDNNGHISVARGANDTKVLLTRHSPYRIFVDSGDGRGWTSRYTAVNAQHSANQVVYGADKFVMITSSGGRHDAGTNLQTSTDGITWTNQGATVASACFDYANGRFVSVRNDGTIKTSTDGITWTNALTGHTLNLGSYMVKPMFANGVWLVWGNNNNASNTTYYTSTDGVNWTARTWQKATNFGTINIPYHIRVANDRFVASSSSATYYDGLDATYGYYSQVLTSINGVDWKTEKISGNPIATGSGSYNFGHNNWIVGWGPAVLQHVGGYYIAKGNPPNDSSTAATGSALYMSKDMKQWLPISSGGRYPSGDMISTDLHDHLLADDYDGGCYELRCNPVNTRFRIYSAVA